MNFERIFLTRILKFGVDTSFNACNVMQLFVSASDNIGSFKILNELVQAIRNKNLHPRMKLPIVRILFISALVRVLSERGSGWFIVSMRDPEAMPPLPVPVCWATS
jgi:hypothetical protein